jgi:PKD repeat protein
MDTCKTYPKFEADQVLTADQLNGLFNYLDAQNRWSRKCFIGAGIACGLEIDVEPSGTALNVSAGSGLTSRGDAVELAQRVLTHYRVYDDPARYDWFSQGDETIALWELLAEDSFDSDDDDIFALESVFIKNKVVLLYLEKTRQDLDTCSGSDCDEKGAVVKNCLRILLADKNTVDEMNQQHGDSSTRDVYEQFHGQFSLPYLRSGRINWLGDEENLLDLKNIQEAYREILSPGFLSELDKAFSNAYETCAPVLQQIFPHNPFLKLADSLPSDFTLQLFYDHVQHLVQAYNEFIDAAFKLFAQCCINDEAFPCHLMLGDTSRQSKCRPDIYRHYFISAMLADDAGREQQRIRSLFERLVTIYRAFKVTPASTTAIKITPGQNAENSLGQRAIPFFYDLKSYPQLRSLWHFSLALRCQSKQVTGYHFNQCVPQCKTASAAVIGVDKSFAGIAEEALLGRFDGIRAAGWSPGFTIADKLIAAKASGFANSLARKNSRKISIASKAMTEPARYPLEFALDSYDFFRIEGQLGKDYNQAYAEINRWIKCYNLPIKLTGLRVGNKLADIAADSHCQFDDLDAIFHTQSEKVRCYLQQTLSLISGLKFDAPEHDSTASEKSAIKAVVVDAISKKPLGDVQYAIVSLKKSGRTGRSGEILLGDLAPGTYTLQITRQNYEDKSISVMLKPKQQIDLGSIEIRKRGAGSVSSWTGAGTRNWMAARASEVERNGALPATVAREGASLLRSMEHTSRRFGIATDRTILGTTGENSTKYFALGNANDVEAVNNWAKGGAAKPQAASMSATASLSALGDIDRYLQDKNNGDVLAVIDDYLYRNNPRFDISKDAGMFNRVYQPVQILATLRSLLHALTSPLLQFDVPAYNSLYSELLERCEKLRQLIASGEYDKFLDDEEKQRLLNYLNLLRQEACFNQFQALMTIYEQRRKKISALQLLSVYSSQHPGMTHVGGCYAGGTFFLVYDDNQRVVLDFSLPYVCCSDCPPLQSCEAYPVTFKLPQSYFCIEDEKRYKFITNIPGGEVTGAGVTREATSGDFYFQPSAEDVSVGDVEFSYQLNAANYSFRVRVEKLAAEISYQVIKFDQQAQTAEVRFKVTPDKIQRYRWDFGDGETSDEAAPVKTYDLSASSHFSVSLEAGFESCEATATQELLFDTCSASFTVKEISRQTDKIRFRFHHPQQATSRLWTFGDSTSEQDVATVEHEYMLAETPLSVDVTLAMENDDCSDTQTVPLSLPASQPLSISIIPDKICRSDDAAEIVVTPQGGKLLGNGLINVGGKPFFAPSHPDVQLGKNVISYFVDDRVVEASVWVDEISAGILAEIVDISPEKQSARVRFFMDEKVDSATVDTGDGNSFDELPFEHDYDISSQTEFTISYTLKNGACAMTGSFKLNLQRGDVPAKQIPEIGKWRNQFSKLSGNERIIKIYGLNNTLFGNIDEVLQTLEKNFSTEAGISAYESGEMNLKFSQMLRPLIEQALEILLKLARRNAAEAQPGYPIYFLVNSLLIELASFSNKNATPNSHLGQTLAISVQGFSKLKKSGVDINPAELLSSLIETAMLANANKPDTQGIISKLGDLL